MKWFLIFFISFNCFALVNKPDPIKTPGSFCNVASKDYYEMRYKELLPICKRNVSTATKSKIFDAYGVPEEERNLYIIDHKMSLFLGGTNDIDNLWPQQKIFSSARLEKQVYLLLKDGVINQKISIALINSVK